MRVRDTGQRRARKGGWRGAGRAVRGLRVSRPRASVSGATGRVGGCRAGAGFPGGGGWGLAWRLRPGGGLAWEPAPPRWGRICLRFAARGANLEYWFLCFITSPNYANKAYSLHVIRWRGWALEKWKYPQSVVFVRRLPDLLKFVHDYANSYTCTNIFF